MFLGNYKQIARDSMACILSVRTRARVYMCVAELFYSLCV